MVAAGAKVTNQVSAQIARASLNKRNLRHIPTSISIAGEHSGISISFCSNIIVGAKEILPTPE